MLKNKKAIYILIPINILIWSYFVYRLVDGLSGEEVVETGSNLSIAKNEISADTQNYVLKLDYEDPFLKDAPKERKAHGLLAGNKNSVMGKKSVAPTKPATVQPKPALPEIKYLGVVKNSSSGSVTAIVSINGESKLVKPNETISGVLFKTISTNELTASIGKETIIVRR